VIVNGARDDDAEISSSRPKSRSTTGRVGGSAEASKAAETGPEEFERAQLTQPSSLFVSPAEFMRCCSGRLAYACSVPMLPTTDIVDLGKQRVVLLFIEQPPLLKPRASQPTQCSKHRR